MMSKILVLLALFALPALSAEQCLALPTSLTKGKTCGPGISCAVDLYCAINGKCAPKLEVGQPCRDSDECRFGANCQGEAGKTQCVALGNPGDICDNDGQTLIPTCGQGLSCSINSTCINGAHGDSCKATFDCQGRLVCQGGVCTAVADGAECDDSLDCLPSSFCDIDGVCRLRKTFGACSDADDCELDYSCIGMAPGDRGQCVKNGERKAGQYCGSTDHLCSSERCSNQYCSSKSVRHCQDNGICGFGEACSCDGMAISEGHGTCTSIGGCFSTLKKFVNCMDEKCGPQNNGPALSANYDGSCANRLCPKEFQAARLCSGAGQLVASALSASLLAFLAVFFSRHF